MVFLKLDLEKLILWQGDTILMTALIERFIVWAERLWETG
jgi:hypothetical protein